MVESKEGSRNGEAATAKRQSSRSGTPDDTEQLVLTMSTARGEIAKIELGPPPPPKPAAPKPGAKPAPKPAPKK